MSEIEFFDRLKERFPAKEYALLPQVRNGTGYSRRVRTADAIAVSLWPSRGIDVHGFEFKDSRSDWLRELKDPEKGEEIGRFCSYWWVVTSDKSVAAPSEIPNGWGMMVAEDRLKMAVKAPRRDPQEPTWLFMASVLKAAAGTVTGESEVERRVAERMNKVIADTRESEEQLRGYYLRQANKQLDELKKNIQEFEDASGVRINQWHRSAKIGEAVNLVLRGMEGVGLRHLELFFEYADTMRAAYEQIKALQPVATEAAA